MSKWKHINLVYLYDETFEGFLSVVFDCYKNKSIPSDIKSKYTYSINFLEQSLEIETSLEKATRVYNGLINLASYQTLYYCFTAFLNSASDKEINIFKYIIHALEVSDKVNSMLTVPYVLYVQKLSKNTLFEAHRLKGLLRFMSIENNIYYASIHPDNQILELLAKHFIKRLPTEKFIIHDKKRNLALLYNTNSYTIVDASTLQLPALSEEELHYQKLWKTFFNTITIKERKNPRLQMQFMPKKYWVDLVELKNNAAS